MFIFLVIYLLCNYAYYKVVSMSAIDSILMEIACISIPVINTNIIIIFIIFI